jgi:Tfp pilus assembly protein PilV
MKTQHNQGFSLAEMLVALGLISVAVLSVLALSISIAKGNQEGTDRATGAVVARQLVNRVLDRLRADIPAGTNADFWDNEHTSTPFDSGVFRSNNTDYQYKVYAQSVEDSSGVSVGGTTPDNRLKKVDVIVWWWDSEKTERQGYGKLEVRNTRLVSEAEI